MSETEHTHEETVELLKFVAFEHGRCCDYYQDSLGGFHCHECGRSTFAMLANVQGVLGKGGGHGMTHKESYKNALVRRAAPKLLEALENIVRSPSGDSSTMWIDDKYLEKYRNLIAEAKGETT